MSTRAVRAPVSMVLAVCAASLVGVVTPACSSQDPGAIHFSNRASSGYDAGEPAPAIDAALPPEPPPSTPPAMDAATAPSVDAASDAVAAVDAADAQPTPAGLAIVSFTLLDTSVTGVINGSPVAGYDPLKDGTTLSLAQVGTNLSVRANIGSLPAGSVAFAYGATNHTENLAPYTLCGDDGAGTINNCNLAAGDYTLTATPYPQPALGGTAGTPLTIKFTITP